MKVHELLDFNKEFLQRLCFAGVKPEDHKYTSLFAEYEQLTRNGEKKTYIVDYLSERYGISERKVYSVINYLNRDLDNCRSHAAG